MLIGGAVMSKNFLKTEKIVKENMKTGNLDVIDDEKKLNIKKRKKQVFVEQYYLRVIT